MTRSHQLGDLQLAIMRVLWNRSEATVSDVHQALHPERGLALTTIATMLKKMEAKGVVQHRNQGRQFIYTPTVAEHEVRRSMVGQLVDRLFRGDPAELVHHLLNEAEVDPQELDRWRELLEQHREGGTDADPR